MLGLPLVRAIAFAVGFVALIGAIIFGAWFFTAKPKIEDPSEAWQKAKTLIEAHEFDDAVPFVRAAARAGLPEAQAMLGLMYLRGQGVDQDETEARRWLRIAAKLGHDPEASTRLARLIETGRGGPADPAEAAQWYALAAREGHSEAMYRLAVMHFEGRAPASSLWEALFWAHQSAQHGLAEAKALVAKTWQAIEERAQHGDLEAAFWLARAYAEGIGTSPDA
ncbi:MAG: sel1 repeat family protein, partial [Zetaproteobacteria bacterium]